MKLSKDDIETIEKVSKITLTNYEVKTIEDEGYIDPYNLINALEDLLCEVDNLEEKISDVKQALSREGLDYLRW